jgi:hypothetical protein
VEDDGVALRITIPARKSWLAIVMLCVWICFWGSAEENALRGRFGILLPVTLPASALSPLLLSAWIFIWSVGGIAVAYVAIWMVFGTERVSIDPTRMTVESEPFSFPSRRVFDATRVYGMRVAPAIRRPPDGGFNLATLREGPIAFDYGWRTFRFGGDIDEAEAAQIVRLVAGRFPRLGA